MIWHKIKSVGQLISQQIRRNKISYNQTRKEQHQQQQQQQSKTTELKSLTRTIPGRLKNLRKLGNKLNINYFQHK